VNKKTVINTEKHEVWIIRQATDSPDKGAEAVELDVFEDCDDSLIEWLASARARTKRQRKSRLASPSKEE
jgi:hypothetical protein